MRRVVLAVLLVLLSLPASASGAVISSLAVNPSQVRDGGSATGTVTLAFPEATATTALLFSSDPGAAQVPATVVIAAGATSADFTITTSAAAPAVIVQLMAAIDNVPRTANLSVNAATPAGPALASVSVTPMSVVGGGGVTGTVRFSGTPDGAVVQLSSSHPNVASVPDEAVVPGGSSSGAFAVTTRAVTATTVVTITARWFGVTRTATVTVTPGAPPAADRVTITRARWDRGLLRIEARSTNPNAILTVLSRSGAFMFTLTNNGGGRYSDQRGWVFNPEQITVRSNLGGSATAAT